MLPRLLVTTVSVLLALGMTSHVAASADLSGRWDFGVRDGKARDLSGKGHHLPLHGSWSRAEGRGGSSAIRFASTAVAKASAHSSLDPGDRPFAVSAAFRIPLRADAFTGTDSPNLAQKGLFDSPGQWKIQLIPRDGGRVQCRMKGSRTTVTVTSSVTRLAADGKWHKVSCVRRDHHVMLVVDGVRTARKVSVGRVASGAPMTVGNKASRPGSDQFCGIVDALAVAKGQRALERTLRATRR